MITTVKTAKAVSLFVAAVVCVCAQAQEQAQEQEITPEQMRVLAEMNAIWSSLNRQTGDISLAGDTATLSVPNSFYFLDNTDAKTVLVDVWKNPPGSADNLLGMLFPSEATPFDDNSWAVTIAYEEDGYVSDADAAEIDYDELLTEMQDNTRIASEERVSNGFDGMTLIGWASPPFYDSNTHKLHWAKELNFGGHAENTLNYNIRVLGRKGVLVLNFIANMRQKTNIETNLDNVLAMANFNPGQRYGDFNPDTDKLAAYGIGALVAGKVLAKTGLLAAAMLFLKKFGIFIALAAIPLFARLFKRKSP